MKLCVKKIYCRRCRKLVKGQERKVDDNIQILCSRCKELICFSDGVTWRYT